MEKTLTGPTEGPRSRPASRRPYRVLFLGTGNSTRSIMAECAMNRWGAGRFLASSAGSHPRGQVHPVALELLQELNYPTERLRSKSRDEFARSESPPLDFVFTVCDKAAGEACPLWPGQPMTAHWGAEDPAAFVGPPEAEKQLFTRIYFELESRIKIFVTLRLDNLDSPALQRRLDAIGRLRPGTEPAPES